VTPDFLRYFAKFVLRWALDDQPPYADPVARDPATYERIERVLRLSQNEPAAPDLDLLARDVLNAIDCDHRVLALGRLLATYKNELKIARASSYMLGQAARPLPQRNPTPHQQEGRCLY
jgi:hypothetical protein